MSNLTVNPKINLNKIRFPLVLSPILKALQNNFFTGKGTGSLSVTRETDSYFQTRYGELRSASVDVPRYGLFSTEKGTGNTNLLTYSEDFTDNVWEKTNVTVTPNSSVNILGQNEASLLELTDTNNPSSLNRTYTDLVDQETYTFSLYLKQGTLNTVRLYMETSGSLLDQQLGTTIDLETNTLSDTTSNTQVSIQPIYSNWVRVSIQVVLNISQPNSISFGLEQVDSNLGTLAIWGSQLETGTQLNDYIKTEEVPVTDRTIEENLGWIVEPEGTNLVESPLDLTNSNRWTQVNNVTVSNVGTQVSPDGVNLMTLINANDSNQIQYVEQSLTIPTLTQEYTVSLYSSAGLTDTLGISLNFSGGTTPVQLPLEVNLQTQEITGSSNLTNISILETISGVYRIQFTYNHTGENNNLQLQLGPNSLLTNNTDTIHVWGVQVEPGSTVGSLSSERVRASEFMTLPYVGNFPPLDKGFSLRLKFYLDEPIGRELTLLESVGFRLGITNTGILQFSDLTNQISSLNPLEPQREYEVIVVSSNNQTTLYLDNISQGNLLLQFPLLHTGNVSLGSTLLNQNKLNGYLKDLNVWDFRLNQEEIRLLFNNSITLGD